MFDSFRDYQVCECNSKARVSAFQAENAGSSPATRSNLCSRSSEEERLFYMQGVGIAKFSASTMLSSYSGAKAILRFSCKEVTGVRFLVRAPNMNRQVCWCAQRLANPFAWVRIPGDSPYAVVMECIHNCLRSSRPKGIGRSSRPDGTNECSSSGQDTGFSPRQTPVQIRYTRPKLWYT